MKELVPDHQGLVLVMLFVVGNTLVFALGGVAGPDIWLAFLLATVLAIPMILLMARVRSLMGAPPWPAAWNSFWASGRRGPWPLPMPVMLGGWPAMW